MNGMNMQIPESENFSQEPDLVWDMQITAEAEVIKADGTIKEDDN